MHFFLDQEVLQAEGPPGNLIACISHVSHGALLKDHSEASTNPDAKEWAVVDMFWDEHVKALLCHLCSSKSDSSCWLLSTKPYTA